MSEKFTLGTSTICYFTASVKGETGKWINKKLKFKVSLERTRSLQRRSIELSFSCLQNFYSHV